MSMNSRINKFTNNKLYQFPNLMLKYHMCRYLLAKINNLLPEYQSCVSDWNVKSIVTKSWNFWILILTIFDSPPSEVERKKFLLTYALIKYNWLLHAAARHTEPVYVRNQTLMRLSSAVSNFPLSNAYTNCCVEPSFCVNQQDVPQEQDIYVKLHM